MTLKILCFDIDNVICRTNSTNDYTKSKPNIRVIKLINELYDKGHTIKIFTARYMGRNNDNIYLANKQGYRKTFKQLKKWNLKFHKLFISKPSFDVFVDDKSFGYKKNWPLNFRKKYL